MAEWDRFEVVTDKPGERPMPFVSETVRRMVFRTLVKDIVGKHLTYSELTETDRRQFA